MRRGTQIIYVPEHTNGDTNHPDAERGFVTSVREDGFVYCRFWNKYDPGELRTKSNSELTPPECLVEVDSYPQEKIDELLEELP